MNNREPRIPGVLSVHEYEEIYGEKPVTPYNHMLTRDGKKVLSPIHYSLTLSIQEIIEQRERKSNE